MKQFIMSPIDQFDSFIKLADGLRELEVTVGAASRPIIAEIRSRLVEAVAFRDKGDITAGIATLRLAMEQLAALAGTLDPSEGALMKMIAQRFAGALAQDDRGTAKESVNFMRHRAGDPKDDPNTDW
jgi:hypothetical protein